MKLIHKFKSPNYNKRKSDRINLIIIHYTALKSISESIKYLCSKNNKVSSHYLISKSGKIYNLISEKRRAWHAGESFWQGCTDINSKSIGIELDYTQSNKNNKFSNKQIKSLIGLLKQLIKQYNIKPENVLGHSDIAPYRKIDPGNFFPWHLLESQKISFQIKKIKDQKNIKTLINKWFFKNKFNYKNKRILFMLNYLGYDISSAMLNKSSFNKLIMIYCSHYRYYKNYYYNKNKIFNVIELHFLNIILTKLKK